MCRLCTALVGGLVQTWMPTPPDPSRVETPAAGGRKSGDCSTTFIHTWLYLIATRITRDCHSVLWLQS